MAKKERWWLTRDTRAGSPYEMYVGEEPHIGQYGEYTSFSFTALPICRYDFERFYPRLRLKPGQCKEIERPGIAFVARKGK